MMPTLEATEYDRFSFDEASQPGALTLDEALKKAKEMRKNDSRNFYRVEIADEGQMTFNVTKVPVESVYADFVTKMAKLMGKYVLRSRRK